MVNTDINHEVGFGKVARIQFLQKSKGLYWSVLNHYQNKKINHIHWHSFVWDWTLTPRYRIPKVKLFLTVALVRQVGEGLATYENWGSIDLLNALWNSEQQEHRDFLKSNVVQWRDAVNKLGIHIETSVQSTEIMPFQHVFLTLRLVRT